MARFGTLGTQYFDNAGDPLVAGKIYFYQFGTTTPITTYADVNQSIPNPNPVILSGAGRQPSIFFAGVAKAVLTDKNDVQVQALEPVGQTSTSFGDAWQSTVLYSANDVVRGSDGEYYESKTNGNVGNDPTIDGTNWKLLFGIEWNSATTYSVFNQVIGSDGIIYESLINDNINNDPVTSQDAWAQVASVGWVETFSYNQFGNARGSDGTLYSSLVDNNVGNDPVSSPAQWVAIDLVWRAAKTYVVGASAIGSNGILYRSLQDDNINNDPVASPAWWIDVTNAAVDAADEAAASAAAALASEQAAAFSASNAAASADAAAISADSASSSADGAAASAQSAFLDAERAEAAANAASGSANFKGRWVDLTGALSIPASVEHEGIIWNLLTNLPDVTASEPSQSNPDWLALQDVAPLVKAPIAISPIGGIEITDFAPTLDSNPFEALYGRTHASSQYQVATEVAFSNIVADSGEIAAVTEWEVSPPLVQDTVYYWRARYKSNDIEASPGDWSDWSETQTFTTSDAGVVTPTNVAPPNGSTDIAEDVVLAASEFEYSGPIQTHVSSDWQVTLATDTGFTSPIWESLGDTVNLESITDITGMVVSTNYIWRVRYVGSLTGASEWSEPTGFTTADVFEALFVAIAHQTAPYISVYPISESGFGTKLSAPSTDLTSTGNAVTFSNDGNFIAIATASAPFINVYNFSASGFGTKVANPSTAATQASYSVLFTPNDDAIVFGTGTLEGYQWSPSGFGAKFANGTSGGFQKGMHPSGTAICSGIDTPVGTRVTPFNSTTGFGAPVSNTFGNGVAGSCFSPNGNYVLSAGFVGNNGVAITSWDGSTLGTTSSSDTPSTSNYNYCCVSNSLGNRMFFGSAGVNSVGGKIYSQDTGTLGSDITAPTLSATGGTYDLSISPDDKFLVASGLTSPYIYLYPLINGGTDFGVRYSQPSSLPTGAPTDTSCVAIGLAK